jgi:hypothetical protein
MSKRLLARAGALLGAMVLSAGMIAVVGAPAQAASLGEVELSQSSGLVTDTPIFALAKTAPCPTGYGENAALRVGRPGGPYSNLGAALGGGGLDNPNGGNPNMIGGKINFNPNRSFQTAIGGTPGAGEWWIIMECFSLTEGRHNDEFRTSIVVSGNSWRVPTPDPTSTALAISPAGTAQLGTSVTLTATVTDGDPGTPGTPAGTVEFRRGSVVIGSASTNASGVATFSTTTLPRGNHQITAVFTPTNGAEWQPSTSAAQPYEITQPAGENIEDITIIANVDQGAFTLTVAANTTTLTGGAVGGSAAGSLPQATVTDLRGTNVGWSLTGSSTDFTQGTNTITRDNLAWTPSAAKVSGSGAVTAGAAADLGDTRTLCSAASGGSAGVFHCDAGLNLSIPDTTVPGEYRATLTLTLA